MIKTAAHILTVLFGLIGHVSIGAPSIRIENELNIKNFGQQVEYFLDVNNSYDSYNSIPTEQFVSCESALPNFNTTNSRVWIRFRLINTSQVQQYLNVNQPSLDYIEIQYGDHRLTLGDFVRIEDRPVKNQNYIFPLPQTPEAGEYIYLKINAGDSIIVPLEIGTLTSMQDNLSLRDILFSIFFGIMLTLLLYNLFIYVRVRERVYGYYIAYIFMILLAQANLHGYTLRALWPEYVEFERHAVFFLISLAGTFGLLFISNYVELYKQKPFVNRVLYFFIFAYGIAMVLATMGLQTIAYNIIQINGTINSLVILWTCFNLWSNGNRTAGFVLISWSIFFIGVISFILKDVGVLPYNTFTVYTMTIGSAIEGILLSFGLADKINILKKEKEEAQIRELEALKLSETKLEEQVRERTHQLQEANELMEVQYHDLQKSQRQLVESEKMAGLGQMTAGIAHELNNPINFVSSNVEPLQKDIEEIMDVLNDFKQLPEEPTQAQIAAIRTKFEEYDVPMLESEITLLLNGIKEGSSRASDIVSGLRIFARADQEIFVNANINDCVNATLVLIKSTWKNEVQLNRVLDEQLPNIECLPGKLNQVIVNLITNAVQASIEHHDNRNHRVIHVETTHDEEFIYLSVHDNGPGIPEAIQAKIFEPFFTTKKVGQGTGLGLSISKSIIEDHQGLLEIKTSMGQGTEFRVSLPRRKSEIAKAA